MLAHSFHRFYIVTKFMLPSMEDIKISKLKFDHTCRYMNKEYATNMDSRKYFTELKHTVTRLSLLFPTIID